MRPYWKGYLKLALVSCPIALHAACSTSERIAFRQINKATGHGLRQQLIDEETREPVPRQQPMRFVRTIPAFGPLPELLCFYCDDCKTATAVENSN